MYVCMYLYLYICVCNNNKTQIIIITIIIITMIIYIYIYITVMSLLAYAMDPIMSPSHSPDPHVVILVPWPHHRGLLMGYDGMTPIKIPRNLSMAHRCFMW